MGKIKQRNWLIIITIFLVIVSGIGLLFSMQEKLSFNSCAYGGEIYRSGENVPNYSGKNDCSCRTNGDIVCGQEVENSVYNGYSSTNLNFTYSYLNLLDPSMAVDDNVTSDSVSYVNGVLRIKLERNVLCPNDQIAPVQSGFYQLSESELKLMIMTSKDAQKYVYPCRIEDNFTISNINVELSSNFQVYYQNESGSLINLGACAYEGVLYGDQEAFKSQDSKSVCLCNTGKVTCKEL